MPAEWTVESQVVSQEELVENYLSFGESINVKALGADLVDKDGLRICLLVGYEIITESGVQAFANLRVNIQDYKFSRFYLFLFLLFLVHRKC